MNPTAVSLGSMTWMEIRLSSGNRCPQSPRGHPLYLLNRFSIATVPPRDLSISASEFVTSERQRARQPDLSLSSNHEKGLVQAVPISPLVSPQVGRCEAVRKKVLLERS